MTTESNEREGVGHDAHFYLDLIEKYQGGRNGPTIQLRAAIEQIEAELARWTPAAAPQAQPSDWMAATPADTVAAEYGAQAQPAPAEPKGVLDGLIASAAPHMAGGEVYEQNILGELPEGPLKRRLKLHLKTLRAARSPEPAPISDERIEEVRRKFLGTKPTLIPNTAAVLVDFARAVLLAEKGKP